jgi:hypothetical protein
MRSIVAVMRRCCAVHTCYTSCKCLFINFSIIWLLHSSFFEYSKTFFNMDTLDLITCFLIGHSNIMEDIIHAQLYHTPHVNLTAEP